MEIIQHILDYSNLTFFQGALLTFLGFLLYWMLVVQKAKRKVKDIYGEKFEFRDKWWQRNAWNVAISFVASFSIFYAAFIADMLSINICLLMGVANTVLTDFIIKALP